MSLQFFFNGIYSASIYILVALGFLIIFRTVRFFHFAHAIVFTCGAYFVFLFKKLFLLPLFVSIPLAIFSSAILGCLMEFSVYRPLRRKNASNMVLLISSLGIYIVFQNIISVMFGDDTKSIRSRVVHEGINIFGSRLTQIQIGIICTSAVFVVLTAVFLYKTKTGKAIRAVSNDSELASISGINSDRIIMCAFAIGSALAGVAGILVSLDIDMTPTMGMNAFMIGVVVVVVGGIESILGIVFGALLLGLVQNLAVMAISSQWQNSIAFIILLIFLFLRPQGFLGKEIKKAKL